MLEGWILALDLGSQKCMGQTAVGRAYVVSKVLVIRRNIRNPADATLLVAIGIPPKLLSTIKKQASQLGAYERVWFTYD